MSKKNVKDLIETNLSLLYSLKAKGIKNIDTAVDYVVIVQTFDLFKHIPVKKHRIEEVAEKCKCSTRTVELALQVLSQETNI